MAATQPPHTTDRPTEIPTESDHIDIVGTTTIGHSGGDQPLYQPQPFYYRAFDNTNTEWDDYPAGIEIGSPGVYNENQSLVFHSGYGYNPQMPYGPYSPVTSPLPSVGGDAQLYSPHQFPYSPPYYNQLLPPTLPYLNSPTPVSQPDLTNLLGIDQQLDTHFFGHRAPYPSVRGSFPVAPGSFSFHESQQAFDGPRSAGLWSDSSKPSERQRSFTSLSQQPIGSVRSFGPNAGMASHQQRSLYGFGSSSNPYGRGYLSNTGSSFGGSGISNLSSNDRSFLSLENSRRHGRETASLCRCNGTLDILSEQNRGPRASKLKNYISSENNSIDGSKNNASAAKFQDESLNRPDFAIDYRDAKFFVIKSYSEDNVHKSIKYGVWASTPNGNRKLDAAYCQAKEKQDACPIFLFFSVNASAQFCGVAEMVGPVNFDKNVDFWQQDKWSGQFPVKWHIIKDVPNSQFRHIVLENNDNKPVTNSRDTQEVKLQQGIEMLTIFKNYETDTSILDDFNFYEERQKAMQERKARQQSSVMSTGIVGGSEHRSSSDSTGDFIKQVSENFALVVRLDDNNNQVIAANTDGPTGNVFKPDEGILVNASSMQTS